MRLTDRSILVRVAIGGVLVAALALAGCGRKGPLEAPGGAELAPRTAIAAVV